MSVSMDEDHEHRIRTMEAKLTAHEARCDERYTQILERTNTIGKTLDAVMLTISKRFDLMLMALLILAISMAIGPEIALRIFGPK